ncbi:MAG: FG-GAP repeat domain-containing protein, partial [Pyrinomonadaceae bacterium]
FAVVKNISQADGDFLQGVTIDRFNDTELQISLSWHSGGKGIQMLEVPSGPSTERWPIAKIAEISQDEALSVGDIDGDGAKDLLLGTKWLRNRGGTWEALALSGDEGLPDRNRLADINGDGKLDAVVGFEAVSAPGDLVWYENSTDGVWRKHVIATVVGPMSLDVGDLDKDGDLDVVVGEHDLDDSSKAKLYIFENADGKGGKWIGHLVAVGDEHHDGAMLVDIDNDEDLDIISIGWGHDRVLLYENMMAL